MTGEELKALRNQLGLSVAAASRQCEVSETNWHRWESGEYARIPEGVIKLFRILNGLEDIPPITRSVRVAVTTETIPISTVHYVPDTDKT